VCAEATECRNSNTRLDVLTCCITSLFALLRLVSFLSLPLLSFSADFPLLFSELRLKHLQSLCRSRFGSLSARIFRTLLVHRRLEETQISEYATAPRKDVRRLLYQMYNAKLISMQEIPRTSDRMPAKTFFLWGVHVEALCETYLENLYFSWCNLRLRLEVETERAKPILDKVDTSKVISEAEKGEVDTWKKAADRLESGLNQLNQLVMLFHDF
jgi:DNA-directed RNA polymerase III subunit RPC3